MEDGRFLMTKDTRVNLKQHGAKTWSRMFTSYIRMHGKPVAFRWMGGFSDGIPHADGAVASSTQVILKTIVVERSWTAVNSLDIRE